MEDPQTTLLLALAPPPPQAGWRESVRPPENGVRRSWPEREAAQAERLARKRAAAASAAPAAEPEAEEVAEVGGELPRPAKKRKLKKRVLTGGDASATKGAQEASNMLKGGLSADADAERDEMLIRHLESKLGMSGDSAKKRRMEASIFDDLGLEDDVDDVVSKGSKEPPSGDEEGGSGAEEVPSGIAAPSRSGAGAAQQKGGNRSRAKAKAKAEAGSGGAKAKRRQGSFASLLQNILS